MGKMGRARNTVKRDVFWRPGVSAARGGGPSLLRRGEKRLRQGHGQGALAGFRRLRATAGQGPNYVGPFCGYVGLCWPMLAYRAGNTCVSALPTATLLVSSWSWLSFCTASVQAGVQGPCRRAKTPWQ